MGRLLHELLVDTTTAQPNSVALIDGDTAITYAELLGLSKGFAAGLSAAGISRNDRIACYLPKQTELVAAVFGASMVGGMFVPVNPVLKAEQVWHIIADCGAKVLVTTSQRWQLLSRSEPEDARLQRIVLARGEKPPAAHGDEFARVIVWDDAIADVPPADTATARSLSIDIDPAAILYTSGSTGKPKGVILSHRNLVCGAESVNAYLENSPQDVILAVLPFSFDAGFSQLTTGFAAGARVVLLNYLVPKDVIRAAERHSATTITGVPPLWNQLATLEWPDSVRQTLRCIANTGGAMPVTTLSTLREQLPQTDVFLMYGLTESFRSTYLPPEQVASRPTSMGKAIPNAEILVVNENGEQCQPGEPGELVHRGALVALGYWNDPERTAERFRPLPARIPELPNPELAVWSGDLVKTDEEGYLYFIGRRDDMIKSSGYRISPTEIEDVVYRTDLVKECAAFGLPDPMLGQSVVVAYTGNSGTSNLNDQLLAECKKALPAYMVPAEFVRLDALPRNPNGKIDRRRIAEDLRHGHGGSSS